MGLLDGELQEVFFSVFAGFLLDGTFHVIALIDDGMGGYTQGQPANYPCKGMVDTTSDFIIRQVEIPITESKLLVLQADVGCTPKVDTLITLDGKKWKISRVEQDPAHVAWGFSARCVG